MAKRKPNINITGGTGTPYRQNFKDLVLKVNEDTLLYEFFPTEIEVLGDVFFKLYLRNKKFLEETLVVDTPEDYIDISLYGVVQPKNRYNVQISGNDIIVTFIEDITRLPKEVKGNDFKIKGKIVDII